MKYYCHWNLSVLVAIREYLTLTVAEDDDVRYFLYSALPVAWTRNVISFFQFTVYNVLGNCYRTSRFQVSPVSPSWVPSAWQIGEDTNPNTHKSFHLCLCLIFALIRSNKFLIVPRMTCYLSPFWSFRTDAFEEDCDIYLQCKFLSCLLLKKKTFVCM